MQYMLLIHSDDAALAAVAPGHLEGIEAEFGAYTEALQKAGVLLGGEQLQPPDATVQVRIRDGRTEVLNGPYAETREQLGGFYLIEVPDLDTALAWAARCPGASCGTVEVRPVCAM